MAEGGQQQTEDSVAPGGQFVEAGEDVAVAEGGQRLGDVARGTASKVPPHLGLEPGVELADVVEGCKNTQAGTPGLPKLPPCHAVQPLGPRGQGQHGFGHGRHVGAVVRERVPGGHPARAAALVRLPPEVSRQALHTRSASKDDARRAHSATTTGAHASLSGTSVTRKVSLRAITPGARRRPGRSAWRAPRAASMRSGQPAPRG